MKMRRNHLFWETHRWTVERPLADSTSGITPPELWVRLVSVCRLPPRYIPRRNWLPPDPALGTCKNCVRVRIAGLRKAISELEALP